MNNVVSDRVTGSFSTAPENTVSFRIVESSNDENLYTVVMGVDHQYFTFAYEETKEQCEWYIKMLQIALGRSGAKLEESNV